MPNAWADRLLIAFVLETSWLLCVLGLAGSPALRDAPSATWAVVLCVGALGLLLATVVPRFTKRSTTLTRGVGVVSFVSGLYCIATSTETSASSVTLCCLGLVLAITGLGHRRPFARPG